MNNNSNKDHFLTQIAAELISHNLAIFVGAGLSKNSHIVDWKGLLRPEAEKLGLDVDKEAYDLVTLAQYSINADPQNKDILQTKIRSSMLGAEPTEHHEAICDLPLHKIWTTNYDTLLENSFTKFASHIKVDVIDKGEQLKNTGSEAKLSIYKMHGSISSEKMKLIISAEDYEDYPKENGEFLHALKTDLIKNTFLFIGFSFLDPNIDYILRSLKTISINKEKPRVHYVFMMDAVKPDTYTLDEFEYFLKKEKHRIDNLAKKNIRVVYLKNKDELLEVLINLNLRARKNNTVLCGSNDGNEHSELCEKLGSRIVENNYNLYTCFAEGVGRNAVTGALKHFGEIGEQNPHHKLRIWPTNITANNNVNNKNKRRETMIRNASSCIIIGGKGGTEEEFKIATRLGKLCIPVGYTGGIAKKHANNVIDNIETYTKYYNFSDIQINTILTELKTLNKKRDINETITSVMNLLEIVREQPTH